MIEHKAQIWEALNDLNGYRQMPREKQQFVDQVEICQQAQAVQEFRLEHKMVIRFIMNHMPDADQFRMTRIFFQLCLNLL